MVISKKEYLMNFIQIMAAVFLIFIFAALLGDSTISAINTFNDKNIEKSVTDHLVFWVLAILFTAIWSAVWVWFKKAEKVCIEYWLSKRKNAGDNKG
jgi:Mg2+/citrate symporter